MPNNLLMKYQCAKYNYVLKEKKIRNKINKRIYTTTIYQNFLKPYILAINGGGAL